MPTIRLLLVSLGGWPLKAVSPVDDDQFTAAERAGFNPYDHVPRRSVPVSITDAEIHGDLTIKVTSFGYLHWPAPPATITVDLRECLRDPHIDPALREMTGLDEPVRDKVLSTPGAEYLASNLAAVASDLMAQGIPVTIAVGCAGGRHRSVVIARDVADRLVEWGWAVELEHRDVHRAVVRR